MERTEELDKLRAKKNNAIITRIGQLKKEEKTGNILNQKVKRLVDNGVLVSRAYEIVRRPLEDYLKLPAMEQLKLLSEKNIIQEHQRIENVPGPILHAIVSFSMYSNQWGSALLPRPIELMGEISLLRNKKDGKELSNPKINDSKSFLDETTKAKELVNTSLKKIYAKIDTLLKKEKFGYYTREEIAHSKEVEIVKGEIEKEYDFSDLEFDDIDLNSLDAEDLFKDEIEQETKEEIKKEKTKKEPKEKKETKKEKSIDDLFAEL